MSDSWIPEKARIELEKTSADAMALFAGQETVSVDDQARVIQTIALKAYELGRATAEPLNGAATQYAPDLSYGSDEPYRTYPTASDALVVADAMGVWIVKRQVSPWMPIATA